MLCCRGRGWIIGITPPGNACCERELVRAIFADEALYRFCQTRTFLPAWDRGWAAGRSGDAGNPAQPHAWLPDGAGESYVSPRTRVPPHAGTLFPPREGRGRVTVGGSMLGTNEGTNQAGLVEPA